MYGAPASVAAGASASHLPGNLSIKMARGMTAFAFASRTAAVVAELDEGMTATLASRAAHGTVGILNALMQLPLAMETKYKRKIGRSVAHCQSMKFASGNYPATLNERNPRNCKLVQWCHGTYA